MNLRDQKLVCKIAPGILFIKSALGQKHPLKTVSYVDLDRYMGDWNVIATIPNFIEKGSIDSIESYQLRKDGKIENQFKAIKADGSQVSLTALAWVTSSKDNANWKVKFRILGIFLPFAFDYQVIALDEEGYEYCAVAHPSRNLGWIMSKSKTLSREIYRELLGKFAQNGYDISRFETLPKKVVDK